jgi:hypothetical protein
MGCGKSKPKRSHSDPIVLKGDNIEEDKNNGNHWQKSNKNIPNSSHADAWNINSPLPQGKNSNARINMVT